MSDKKTDKPDPKPELKPEAPDKAPKVSDSERIDHIVALLERNGMSLPKALR